MKSEKKGKEWKERRERSKKRNIEKCTKLKKRQIKKIIMKNKNFLCHRHNNNLYKNPNYTFK